MKKNGHEDCVVLFVGESGSGFHFPKTKKANDFIGIFVSPISNVLRLQRNRVIQVSEEGEIRGEQSKGQTYQNGFQMIELGFAISMICNGNHRYCLRLIFFSLIFRKGFWNIFLLKMILVLKQIGLNK